MCNYRHKAPNGVYYFRRAIPEHLRPFLGSKREIKFTLRTKDGEVAKRLIPQHTISSQADLDRVQAAFDAAAQPPKAPKSQAQLDRERARWEWEQEQHDWMSKEAQEADNEIEELEPIMDALEAGQVPDASRQDVARAAQLAIAHVRQISRLELEREASKRSQVNVRNHLAYLRTLLEWAVQSDVIEINPASNVRIRLTEKPEDRKGFDIDDLTRLFSGPIHSARALFNCMPVR